MNKSFLIDLGISDEVAAKIMAENGRDINREQNKFADYDDLKAQLKTVNDQLASFGEYKSLEDINKKLADVKAENEKALRQSQEKMEKMERSQRIKDFTSVKKFVNDPTRNYINSQLDAELLKPENKDKKLEDIFDTMTKGMENIFVKDDAPKAPTVAPMTKPNDVKESDSEATNRLRSIMGLGPKKN